MNKFGIARVNEPSVFEPLKFYCIFSVKFVSNYVKLASAKHEPAQIQRLAGI